jgi:tetratricopeptide (TPR) repeat protein
VSVKTITKVIVRTVAVAILAVVTSLATIPAAAQYEYPVTALDSLERARDSILTAASIAVAEDSTQVEEFHKIVQIYKARKQRRRQLECAHLMRDANPGSALAYFLYGDALLDNSQPQGAIEQLDKALLITPAFVRARIALSEAHTMLQHYDSALAQLDTAIEQNTRNADAHMRRARLLKMIGREREGIENYRAASELLPQNYDAWFNLGDLLLKYGPSKEAAEVLSYVVELKPDSADALILYAEARYNTGEREEALEAYKTFMLRFPTHPRAMEAERLAREMGWRP